MKTVLLYLLCIYSVAANSQLQVWKTYLGESPDSFFTYTIPKAKFSSCKTGQKDDNERLYSFAGYSAFYHCISNSKSEKQKSFRKTSIFYNKQGQAYFGRTTDTCFVDYKAGYTIITDDGPLINLISANDYPRTDITHIYLEGSGRMNDTSCYFLLNYSWDSTFETQGWMILRNDTLHFDNATQLINVRKGKIKDVNPYYKTAIVLKKAGTVYAALDFFGREPVLRVSKKLNEKDKIKILACFFIIECYAT